MPRPTKLAVSLSHTLDATPSQVQGWLEMGYGPADGKVAVEHFERLTPLMGTGRDGDVAVLKMAADGWPCIRLRQVLLGFQELGQGEVDSGDADELVEYAMTSPHLSQVAAYLRKMATLAELPAEYTGPESIPREPDLPDIRARAAFLPFAMALHEGPVDGYDLAESDELLDVALSTMLDDDVPKLDEEGMAALAAMTNAVSQRMREVPAWILDATTEDLVAGVQASQKVLEALGVMGLRFDGDEEHWRWIGRLAPTAAELVTSLANVMEQVYIPLVTGQPLPRGEQQFVSAILGRSVGIQSGDALATPSMARPSALEGELNA